MRKWLAIFGLLVLTGGARSQVPRNGSEQHDNAQEQQKPADPSKPVVAIESPAAANNQDHASEKPAKYPWGELLAPANIPNWFLVIVGGVTGWFVYKTLRAIKKQADIMETQAEDARESGAEATRIALATAQAARKSADAAKDQIQMMKNRERARLAVKVFRIGTLYFGQLKWNPIKIEIENFGPTNAFNVRASGDANAIVEGIEPLPEEFNDLMIPTVIRPSLRPVETELRFFFPEEWADTIALRPRMRIELRGIVEYEDVFGEEHFTKFEYIMRIVKWGKVDADNIATIHPFSQWHQPDHPEANRAT
jgi:hypothetical protein